MRASSLSKAFILRVLLVLVIIQAAVFAFSYQFEQAELEKALRLKVEGISRLIGYASQQAIEESDFTQLGLLMDESLKDVDLVLFKLEDPSKYELLNRKKTGTVDRNITFPVVRGGETIGALTIGYSLNSVTTAMNKRMLVRGGELALLLVAISAMVIMLFRSRIAARVEAMEGSLEKATNGDLTVTMTDNRNDEISRIVAGINFLIGQLRSSFARIAELSAASAATTGALVASFNESLDAMAMQKHSTQEISAAVDKAAQSYSLITKNTQQLHVFSEQNTIALKESVTVSKDVATRIELLNSGMNDAHVTVAAINKAAVKAANLAEQATSEARKGSASADNVRDSVSMITRVISQSADQTDRTTRVISEKGMVAVSETKRSMANINQLAESLTVSMLKLDAGSKDIAKIVAVIEEIAKRTRLLSLNTSIIAAQAGEYGKSFLVVANEMKELSDQTANHTMEIAGIIGSIQDGIGDAVAKTRNTSKLVEEGSLVVAHAGEALEEILAASQDSASMVRRVMEAAEVQQRGLEEILSSLDHLEKINSDVSTAMINEQGNIDSFASTIETLCKSMEVVSSSTEQQVVTMHNVMNNLVGANDQISQIAAEIAANQHENVAIAASVATVIEVTVETVDTLKGASSRLTDAFSGIDQLREEMEKFTI